MKLSIIIPVRNEEQCIEKTVSQIILCLNSENIPHEIVIVNDGSEDATESVLQKLDETFESVRYVNNHAPNGFGLAIRKGFECYEGDAVAIVMGDGSDSPGDIVKYYRKLEEGYECVFGSRFISGSKVDDYPFHKLFLNRLANCFVKLLFRLDLNDTTNAFKCYRRETIEGLKPFLSNHFNITVELPLKAIIRGFNYAVVPVSWTNRKEGISKLKIKEMGSRYLFIVLYLFLEKTLCRGDYYRQDKPVVKAKVEVK